MHLANVGRTQRLDFDRRDFDFPAGEFYRPGGLRFFDVGPLDNLNLFLIL